MAEVIKYRFRLRRRTAANWVALNEILLDSEMGVETDAVWPDGMRKVKIGDGVTAWNDLAYFGRMVEVTTAIPIVGGVATMDCSLGRFFTLALNVSATLVITNPPAVDCMLLRVTPSAGAALTLPGNVAMLDGSVYATGTALQAIGLMTFDTGSTFNAVVAQP